MNQQKNTLTAHASILGIFMTLLLILAAPLIIFSTQQQQDIRQRAAGPEPSVNILPPQEGYGYIASYVYLDQNKNGQRESGEKGIPNMQIKITQTNPNIVTTLTTDENGYSKYQLTNPFPEKITITAELIIPAGYKTINTNPRQLQDIPNDTKTLLEFGLYPTGQ